MTVDHFQQGDNSPILRRACPAAFFSRWQQALVVTDLPYGELGLSPITHNSSENFLQILRV
jgi:hypothetical protein